MVSFDFNVVLRYIFAHKKYHHYKVVGKTLIIENSQKGGGMHFSWTPETFFKKVNTLKIPSLIDIKEVMHPTLINPSFLCTAYTYALFFPFEKK